MIKTAVVYRSGYGYTAKQVQAVAQGAGAALETADAIIMGAPTYMGSTSWQFKKFADASSKPWFTQKWKNKIAAGFTNSASMNGDKLSTLHTCSRWRCSTAWSGSDPE